MQALFTLVFAGTAFANGAATWCFQTVWPDAFHAPSSHVEKVVKAEEPRRCEVYSPRHESAVAIASESRAVADLKFRRWKGYRAFWSDVVVVAEPITNRVVVSAPSNCFGEVMTAISGLDRGPNERITGLLNQSENLIPIEEEWNRIWFSDQWDRIWHTEQPSHLTSERVDGAIQ